jgi:hypothetical protein
VQQRWDNPIAQACRDFVTFDLHDVDTDTALAPSSEQPPVATYPVHGLPQDAAPTLGQAPATSSPGPTTTPSARRGQALATSAASTGQAPGTTSASLGQAAAAPGLPDDGGRQRGRATTAGHLSVALRTGGGAQPKQPKQPKQAGALQVADKLMALCGVVAFLEQAESGLLGWDDLELLKRPLETLRAVKGGCVTSVSWTVAHQCLHW